MYYNEYLNLKSDLEKGYKTAKDYEKSLQKLINKIIVDIQKRNIEGDVQKVISIIDNVKTIEVPLEIKKRFDNILLNESEIAERKTILKSKARVLYCVVTTLCNVKCIMCRIIKNQWELPEHAIDEIVELMPYLENVKWQGGEVFLYKHFERLLDEAGKNDVSQEIVTNGLLLNERIIKKLVNYNVDLYISIDGLTKDVYESIRVGADFDLLINNLSIMKRIQTDYSNHVMNLGLNVLVMKKNLDQIEFFPEFAVKYGFRKLCINALGPDFISDENIFHYNKNKDFEIRIMKIKEQLSKKSKELNLELFDCLPTFDNIDSVSNNLIKDETEYKTHQNEFGNSVINNEKFGMKPNNAMLCHIPWQKIFIDSYGIITPECFCDKNNYLGNIAEDKIADIWNGKIMQEYRNILAGKMCNLKCSKNCINGITHSKSLKDVINPNLFWRSNNL